MTDEQALLAAMAADPSDDTVRLAYADFLEETGRGERAEFVRVQVELNRSVKNGPERHALVVRHVKFLREFVPRWRAELPRLPGIEWGDFSRGLIEEVQGATEAALVRHAAAVFAEPGVHVVRLARLNDGRALAAVPQLARVRSLRVIGARAEDGVLRSLFASPFLGGLHVLDLHGNWLADAGAIGLAAADWPALSELWLGSNLVGDAGARALASSPHFPALRLLDLRDNPITDVGARSMLRGRFKSGVKV